MTCDVRDASAGASDGLVVLYYQPMCHGGHGDDVNGRDDGRVCALSLDWLGSLLDYLHSLPMYDGAGGSCRCWKHR